MLFCSGGGGCPLAEQVDGSYLLDGQAIQPKEFKRMSGYVMQVCSLVFYWPTVWIVTLSKNSPCIYSQSGSDLKLLLYVTDYFHGMTVCWVSVHRYCVHIVSGVPVFCTYPIGSTGVFVHSVSGVPVFCAHIPSGVPVLCT